MKKKMSPTASIETHNLTSRQFPAGSGSDLVNTNAIPYSPVPDVDGESWGNCCQFTFSEPGKVEKKWR